jgi:uncharacterized protein
MIFDGKFAVALALGLFGLLVVLAAGVWRRRLQRGALSGFLRAIQVLGVVGLGLWIWAWVIEPQTMVVRTFKVQSAAWKGAPMTVAVIADTHVGFGWMPASRVDRIIARANALKSDAVLLLGDYAGGDAQAGDRRDGGAEVLAGVGAFSALKSPEGTFAILGNHDTWFGREPIAAALDQAGARVLRNGHAIVTRDGGQVVIAGVRDQTTDDEDVPAALAGMPDNADVILLTHDPDVFAGLPAEARDRVALTLAGHTHCGQVYVPGLGRPMIPSRYGQRYACGLIEENGRHLVVTGGLGGSILPVRFLTPPEIALVTIEAAPTTQ